MCKTKSVKHGKNICNMILYRIKQYEGEIKNV